VAVEISRAHISNTLAKHYLVAVEISRALVMRMMFVRLLVHMPQPHHKDSLHALAPLRFRRRERREAQIFAFATHYQHIINTLATHYQHICNTLHTTFALVV